MNKNKKINLLFLLGLFILVSNSFAESSLPFIYISENNFHIDDQFQDESRRELGIAVEEIESKIDYAWDPSYGLKLYAYSSSLIGDSKAKIKGTHYFDFSIIGFKDKTVIEVDKLRIKIRCFGLVDKIFKKEKGIKYSINITAGIKDETNLFWKENMVLGKVYGISSHFDDFSPGYKKNKVKVVWDKTLLPWRKILKDQYLASTAWVTFNGVKLISGKTYRVFLSNDIDIWTKAVQRYEHSVKVDFFKKEPFFNKDTVQLNPFGFGVEKIEIYFPKDLDLAGNEKTYNLKASAQILKEDVKDKEVLLKDIKEDKKSNDSVAEVNKKQVVETKKKKQIIKKELTYDLAVSKFSLTQSNIVPGQFLEAKAEIINKGKNIVYGLPVSFFAGKKLLSTKTIRKLSPQEKNIITFPFNLKKQGIYPVKVVVDKDNLIKDENRQNNSKVVSLIVKSVKDIGNE